MAQTIPSKRLTKPRKFLGNFEPHPDDTTWDIDTEVVADDPKDGHYEPRNAFDNAPTKKKLSSKLGIGSERARTQTRKKPNHSTAYLDAKIESLSKDELIIKVRDLQRDVSIRQEKLQETETKWQKQRDLAKNRLEEKKKKSESWKDQRSEMTELKAKNDSLKGKQSELKEQIKKLENAMVSYQAREEDLQATSLGKLNKGDIITIPDDQVANKLSGLFRETKGLADQISIDSWKSVPYKLRLESLRAMQDESLPRVISTKACEEIKAGRVKPKVVVNTIINQSLVHRVFTAVFALVAKGFQIPESAKILTNIYSDLEASKAQPFSEVFLTNMTR
jgi:myosin heavy subunit